MQPVPTLQPTGAQKSPSKVHLLSPPFLLLLSPTFTSQWVSQGLQSGASGYCSTYQDPLTPLPGVCGVVALVQGKANVVWILQFPIGELDCKITVQE